MHTVSIWATNRNDDKLTGPYEEPSILVGYDEPLLKIVPQVNGRGYGLTVMDMDNNIILLVDLTDWNSKGVLERIDKPVISHHDPTLDKHRGKS
jgi:hypothetical protein